MKAGNSATHAAPSALNQFCFSNPRPDGRGYSMTVLRTSLESTTQVLYPTPRKHSYNPGFLC